jgi:hypothetical protein
VIFKVIKCNIFKHVSATSSPQVLSFKLGEELDAVVSHVESPYQIYVYASNKEAAEAVDRYR